MIKSFRHKGLQRLYQNDSVSGVQPADANRLRIQLVTLDSAAEIEDMSIPDYCLHPLQGKELGRWSVWVNGNWRTTFEFRDGYVLDYADYC